MKHLLMYFKKLKQIFINKKKIDNETKKIYDEISVGDVIWARRFHNEEEKKQIPTGHREGPFIVVGKINDILMCSNGTSSEPLDIYTSKYYTLKNQNYSLERDGYYRLCDLKKITVNEFIRKIDFLNEKELEDVFKGIKRNKGNRQKDMFLELPFQVGDIVLYKNLVYLIIDINEKINILPLKKKKINLSDIKNIDYSKIEQVNKENLKSIGFMNNEMLSYILDAYKEYIIYLKKINSAQRGSVIFKDNEYYYIYGEESDNWLAFKIFDKKINDFEKVEFNKKIYYTRYEENKINKKDKFEIISLCRENEIDNIKEKRNEYKKRKKTIDKQDHLLACKVGAIIHNVHYKNKRYIIIGTHNKTVDCLNINQIIKGIYNPLLFKKSEIYLSKNTSIKGIKWLEEYPNFKMSSIDTKIEDIINLQREYLNNENKSLKLERKNNNLQISQPSKIKVGSIIVKKESNIDEYIVEQILGDIVVCIRFLEKNDKNKTKFYFNKADVMVIKKEKRK